MKSKSRAADLVFRQELIKREAAQALFWTAVAMVALTAIYAIVGGYSVEILAVHAAEAAVLLVGAVFSRQSWMRPVAVPWLIAFCVEAVIGGFLYENYVEPSDVGMGVLMVVMVVAGPFILDTAAAAVASVPMLVGTYIVTDWAHPGQAGRWTVVALSGIVVGGILLRTRLRALDALGEALARNEALATIDPLSGLFNRRGLEDRIPTLVGIAARASIPVFVGVIDVDGLKHANDEYGHGFGDEVIVAVATALRRGRREGDLVGRWGGDEFIVVGLGTPPDPDEYARRIHDSIAAGGIDLSRWPGLVSIGVAGADAAAFSLDVVVHEADTDMYARRRVQRSSGPQAAVASPAEPR